ncbi:MAG: two-component sensor histidine kinase [Caulobacteraceae bacterium]|nr:two-component sensor histidine kinase [Caulobacteraceae bacterium]
MLTCALGGAACAPFAGLHLGQLAAALLMAATPALAGFWLAGRRDPLLLAAWAIGAIGAGVLTGGVSGPLFILCLSPVAAAAGLGGGRRFALAGALSLACAGILALLQLAGLCLPPSVPAIGLGLLGLALVGGSLAIALAAGHARASKAERRRDQAYARLKRVVSGHPGLLILLAPDGRVKALYGEPLPGVDHDLVRRESLAALAAPRDREAMEAAIAKAGNGRTYLRFSPKGAEDRRVDLALHRTEAGEMVISLRDATPDYRRESSVEEARQRAEAESSNRSRFLAAMSHELRTPLNAIIGFSDIMRQRLFGPLSDRYAEYAQLIHESGQHLLDLIGDVLDISKIDADRYELSREVFDAREAVQAALRLVRPQADMAGVILRADLGSTPLEVDADRRAIKQMVLNLVANALKFTPKTGSVTVTTAAFGEMLELVVSDTGVGIASGDLARLGKPFEQAGDMTSRRQGTGLGLSLVHAFAGLHGGDMTIESALGEGTSVTVRLPLLAPRPVAPEIAEGGNVVRFTPPTKVAPPA